MSDKELLRIKRVRLRGEDLLKVKNPVEVVEAVPLEDLGPAEQPPESADWDPMDVSEPAIATIRPIDMPLEEVAPLPKGSTFKLQRSQNP